MLQNFKIRFSCALLLVYGAGMATEPALAGVPANQEGQKIFQVRCAQCHGKDAKGKAKMVKIMHLNSTAVDLTRPAAVKLSFEDMVKIVTNGRHGKRMPQNKGKLTAHQIELTVQYLRSLQAALSSNTPGQGEGK